MVTTSIISAVNALIALMTEAVCTSEIPAIFYQTTWCNIPEDSHLYTRWFENLKSHLEINDLAVSTGEGDRP
jgi:hypothetical protein